MSDTNNLIRIDTIHNILNDWIKGLNNDIEDTTDVQMVNEYMLQKETLEKVLNVLPVTNTHSIYDKNLINNILDDIEQLGFYDEINDDEIEDVKLSLYGLVQFIIGCVIQYITDNKLEEIGDD